MKNLKTAMETAPNEEYLEMNFVGETATGRGNNQQFIMENLHDGTFRATEARVGITIGRHRPRSYVLPMEQWQDMFRSKTGRGYLVTKTQKMEKKIIKKSSDTLNGVEYKPIEDASVNEIVTRLIQLTAACLSSNYTIKMDDISDEMISYGQQLLDILAKGYEDMSIAEFNNKLKVLYAAIPRRMDNLSKFLAKRKVEFRDMLANEQELFDIMVSQVRSDKKLHSFNTRPTVLEAYSLQWCDVTPEEEQMIRGKLERNANQYVHAWKVRNLDTEQRFEQFCAQEGLTEKNGISHLFHGSRNENFWSIVTTGLNINPSNVTITGKMFGNGTYFAPLAQKSLGYTSRLGSRWANGNASSGFLALYKVATGRTFDTQSSDSSLNWNRLQQVCPGAHSTWAHAGTQLMNDEVIVYRNEQSTIEYLIEMSV